MPKIDVNESLFFQTLGRRFEKAELAELLVRAKAELDDWDTKARGPSHRAERHQPARPVVHAGPGPPALHLPDRQDPRVPLLLPAGDSKDAGRPARRRGQGPQGHPPVYRQLRGGGPRGHRCAPSGDHPVPGEALQQSTAGSARPSPWASPGRTSSSGRFATAPRTRMPRGSCRWISTRPLSMREILTEHPKGKEYGPIVAAFAEFPLLSDSKGEVLTFPPVINSALIGGVKVGDTQTLHRPDRARPGDPSDRGSHHLL